MISRLLPFCLLLHALIVVEIFYFSIVKETAVRREDVGGTQSIEKRLMQQETCDIRGGVTSLVHYTFLQLDSFLLCCCSMHAGCMSLFAFCGACW